MDITIQKTYKAIIRELFKTFPNSGRGAASRLADFLNVNTTFISQVMNSESEKHFSLEQAFKVTQFFEMNELERDYFLTLLNLERSGTKDLEKYYEQKLSEIKNKFHVVKNRVGKSHELNDSDKAIYYSDWKYQAVKLSTDLKDCHNLRDISEKVKIPMSKLHEVFDFLIEHGLIIQEKNKLKMGVAKTHIPANSPLVKKHHTNWRLKALEHMDHLSDQELAFTAPLTISKKDFSSVREEILTLIQTISKKVEKSESEEIACLNIDWFKIS